MPKEQNVEADRLSKGDMSPHEWELNPRYLQPLFQLQGTLDIELFANLTNSKCKFFFSRDSSDTESVGDALFL